MTDGQRTGAVLGPEHWVVNDESEIARIKTPSGGLVSHVMILSA